MSRTCGVTFALAFALFFPFPNVLVAPGYSVLPDIHMPTFRQTATELPPPWNHRSLRVLDETRWFYDETTHQFEFLVYWTGQILLEILSKSSSARF